jgi:AcrR family transcriptional regulator
VLTIREKKQADKRERIKLAARSLFAEYGFDKTTLREIAARASVGLGTIMLYADDKRDLVLLMYNDEVTSLIAAGTEKIVTDADVVSNILSFCEVFYHSFASNVELARTYLQLNFYSEGANTVGLHLNRGRKLDALRTVIEIGRLRGEVRLDASVDAMATATLLLYRSAVRTWIAEPRPDPVRGLVQLRQLMQLQYQGIRETIEPSETTVVPSPRLRGSKGYAVGA